MQPVVIGDVVWKPTPAVIERSRLKRFMDQYGIAGWEELLERSTADPEWFWDAVVKDLDIRFRRPYQAVLNRSRGAERNPERSKRVDRISRAGRV